MPSQKLIDEYARDPAAFRRDLWIEVSGTLHRLGDVIEPWQAADFAAIEPAMKQVVGRLKYSDEIINRTWLERPRGHSKTTDLAVVCCWMLAFAGRPLRGYAYAKDKEQAGLLKDAIERIVRFNPWLSEVLEVQKDSIVNKNVEHQGYGSRLVVSASDVASSWGLLPDWIIADEVCHWQGDGSLWHSILSSCAKKKTSLLVAITNAGFVGEWSWKIREVIRNSSDTWYFARLEGPQASWMTRKVLEEQRRMLPEIAYLRLWENRWSSGLSDAISESDINAAFDETMKPMIQFGGEVASATDEFVYVAGVDLGIKRDCSACVVLACGKMGSRYAGRIRLATAKVWKPPKGGKVDLMDIERFILEVDEKLGLERVAFDPWQAEMMAQRLETISKHGRRSGFKTRMSGPWLKEVPPTSTNLRDIAHLVLESFADRRLQLYPYEALRNDLLHLKVEEKSYGYRLTSPRDSSGHGDTYYAFSLALFAGHNEISEYGPPLNVCLEVDNFSTAYFDQKFEDMKREEERIQNLYNQNDGDNEGVRQLLRLMRLGY